MQHTKFPIEKKQAIYQLIAQIGVDLILFFCYFFTLCSARSAIPIKTPVCESYIPMGGADRDG